MGHVYECPNCKDSIVIETNDIRCGKFVHAIYKSNMKRVNPHSSIKFVQRLMNSGKIYGCGTSFTFDQICKINQKIN